MNRRFFGKRFTAGAIAAGISGVLGAATRSAGSSHAPENILQLDFEDSEYLMFKADKIIEYEIEKTGEYYDWRCKYTVLMDDGSRVRRMSHTMLLTMYNEDGEMVSVDIAPIGCVAE